MRPLVFLASALLPGCSAALSVPGTDTAYLRRQLDLARTAPNATQGQEARILKEAAAKLEPLAAEEASRIETRAEVEGLLDLEAPGARDFLAAVGDPAKGDAVLAATPLGLETVLLAAYARNLDVQAARSAWRAAVATFDQATYLEDVLLRYRAFARESPSGTTDAKMGAPAFPYPSAVALKGEMVAREVAIAREGARMRLRQVLVRAAKAYLGAAHHEEEIRIRGEQVKLADRLLETARARTSTGRGVQAELLEAEAERAQAVSMRDHATAARPRYLGELNAVLDRSPDAALTLTPVGDPPRETPATQPFLDMAGRYSAEVRSARAELERADLAIRMAEAMLFVAPAPGAVGAGSQMPRTDRLPASSPSPSPLAFGPDLAWVRELRERRAALEYAVAESVRTAEQRVATARFNMDAARRKFAVASQSAVPLSKQAVDERMRLYETGRSEFADLIGAYRRYLEATHEVLAGRYEYAEAEAEMWEATSARASVVTPGASTGGGR